MSTEDERLDRGADEWESFERRFRAEYDATPLGAPRIVMPRMVPVRSRRMHVLAALGGLAAAAGLALIVGRRRTPDPATLSGSPHAPLLHFAIGAPAANRVALVGDFNQWDPHASPLVRSADGRWQAHVAVPPGRYEYAFVIDDGQWVTDPLAPRAPDVGFGHSNSVVLAQAEGR